MHIELSQAHAAALATITRETGQNATDIIAQALDYFFEDVLLKNDIQQAYDDIAKQRLTPHAKVMQELEALAHKGN